MGYTCHMEQRRTTWGAALRLAIAWSVMAVGLALALYGIDIPQPAIVLGVIVVGFVSSWVRTAPTHRSHRTTHRVANVPVRGVHFPIG